MEAQNILLMSRSSWRANCSRALLAVFLLIPLALSARAQTNVQTNNQPRHVELIRHHVIFLLDASGSVPKAGSEAEYLSLIRNKLPHYLGDPSGNAFGVAIYDPNQDLSSVFAFGLSRQEPVFSPSSEHGFMTKLWFQEKGKTYNDISQVVPPFNRYWTAINSAFIQSVRKVHWEAEQSGGLDWAFNRTFIVVISDGKSNTSMDSLDEIRNIYGAAVAESNVSPTQLREDYDAAQSYYGQLTNLFALSASSFDAPGKGADSIVVDNYKVFIRELRPQKLVNLGDLLERAPDQVTQLGRRAHDRYVGTLALMPHPPDPKQEVTYELVDLKYRMPGQSDYRSANSLTEPFEQDVNVSGDKIEDATADFQLSFLRRDPVYGQSVQVFEQKIRFQKEPRRYLLGVIPITDLLMNLHPSGMTQETIQYLDSFLIVGAFVIFLYMLLFPAPRAEMELVGGPKDAFKVPFQRFGERSEQQLLLRTLRFKNTALRRILGRALPRLAERPFDVQLQIQSEFPSSVVSTDRAVGIEAQMLQEPLLTKQTQGSETTILFSPDALADYLGANSEPVKCEFTVHAVQRGRRFRLVPFSRSLEPQTQSYYVSFSPEEPDIRFELRPCLAENFTGTTDTVPFSATDEHAGPITWPHFRGRKDEEGAEPEFYLQISNDAQHRCSKSGLARLKVVVYRAHRKGETWSLVLDEPYRDVIHVDPHDDPVKVPIWMPYDQLPPPASTDGDDYIVEATLTAAEGQGWASQILRYGVRVGPDERTTALSFKVGTSDERAGNDLRWHTFGSIEPGAVLSVNASKPVLWNVGKIKESPVFAKITLDNVARLGAGSVSLKLKPEAEVRIHPAADPGSEPYYTTDKNKIVSIGSYPLGTAVEWRIENEASQRPVLLNLQFQPNVISSMQRRPPYFDYVCVLPFECTLQTSELDRKSFPFTLEVNFRVERYAGEYALAIDFGTSAVVAAFEQDEQLILNRHNDVSFATQNLQQRYQDLVKDWQHSPELDLREVLDFENTIPNMEHDTAFIPSALMMRDGKEIGEANFVTLPVSLMQMSKSWDRTVYYLKGLILGGYEVLEYHQVKNLPPLKWRDGSNRQRVATEDPVEVDEIIRSAYRHLFTSYIEPLLNGQDKLDYLDRLVISYPNNFTVSHKHRIRQILSQTFPQFRSINLLSESNAVALYCARNAARFFRERVKAGDARHLLVYDIGAGTADLTYTKLLWESEQGASVLREMRVLFKAGIPVAGNRLDACLAMIIDEKIRSLIDPLKEQGITLNYSNRIVDPEQNGFDPALYAARMLELKRMLLRLKLQMSDPHQSSYLVEIKSDRNAVNTIANLKDNSIDDDNVLREKLRAFDMTFVRDKSIGITLTRDEILAHPQIISWLTQVSDGLIKNLAGALQVLGLKPEIDTLILSGRTAQFPPLRDRLIESIKDNLGLDQSTYYAPLLESNENKEAVALGSLMYTILNDRTLRLVDRNVWAKYGIIYDDGTRRRFQEFFGYATEALPHDETDHVDGMRVVFFRRTHVITRGVGPIEIAATFSHDPDAALRDFETYLYSFQVLHKVGAGQLPPAGPLKITMANNRDDTISVIIDPDKLPNEIMVRGYRKDANQVQMEWPYQPLSAKVTGSKGKPEIPQ